MELLRIQSVTPLKMCDKFENETFCNTRIVTAKVICDKICDTQGGALNKHDIRCDIHTTDASNYAETRKKKLSSKISFK